MTLEVSKHAYERMRSRCGWNKSAATKMANLAYEEGIRHKETSGALFNFIASKTSAYMIKGNFFKIYGEMIYCFHHVIEEDKVILLTVYLLPSDVRKQALRLQKKKLATEVET